MNEKWNEFVYELIEALKRNVEEEEYHAIIENQLKLLGWVKYKGEICHKPNVPIGNSKHIQPDILIKHDDEEQFVIEVKRPVHSLTERERLQLESYMRQLKLKVGIYIGEHIEVFYDHPDSRHAVSVFIIPLEMDNKRGARFTDLFAKENFSKENITEFCETRIKEMHHQENLNKVREDLIANAQVQIAESLKTYLFEKYSSSFTEQDIENMLATLHFAASTNGEDIVAAKPAEKILPAKKEKDAKPAKNIRALKKEKADEDTADNGDNIPCFIRRNGIDARGIFNKNDKTVLLLKGSRIDSNHSPAFTAGEVEERNKKIDMCAERKDGQIIVTSDMLFKTPSGAGKFCTGHACNGWADWRDSNNQPLQIYRN